ncbi:MAG: hypothetical protein SWH78_13325 [Thermodesulfobacteriota bacterium]|nr:hypothetical protein [Thermodesulfobacteriota bacterium]
MRDFLDNIAPAREPGISPLDRFRNRLSGGVLGSTPTSAGALFGRPQGVLGRVLGGLNARSGLERFGLFASGTNGTASGPPVSNQGGYDTNKEPGSACGDTAPPSVIGGWAFETPVATPPEPWYQLQ